MRLTFATPRAAILFLLAILQSAAAQAPASQAQKSTNLEAELRAVLRERWDALARNDTKAYGALLDDDVVVPDNGLVYDKKILLERAVALKGASSDPREVQVHGYNDTAVMVYRTTSREPYLGEVMTQELRIVETYVKRSGRWLLAARAEMEIPNANRVPVKVTPEILDAYVGEYQINPGNVVKVTREGDTLMEQEPGEAHAEADLPLSENSFFQREQPGVLTFTRSADGKVDAYVLWIYDTTITGKKIK